MRLWNCDACGQENTDEDVRCTQCFKEYEGEEMEGEGEPDYDHAEELEKRERKLDELIDLYRDGLH